MVRVDDQVEAIDTSGEGCELIPETDRSRVIAQDSVKGLDGLRPLPLAGESHGLAIGGQRPASVLWVRRRGVTAARRIRRASRQHLELAFQPLSDVVPLVREIGG